MLEGKHAAEFYVEVQPEFLGDRVYFLRATKFTKSKPETRQGCAYVKVKIIMDDQTWNRSIPEAVAEVPVDAIGPIEVETGPMTIEPPEGA